MMLQMLLDSGFKKLHWKDQGQNAQVYTDLSDKKNRKKTIPIINNL